jgi:hypothetical protein
MEEVRRSTTTKMSRIPASKRFVSVLLCFTLLPILIFGSVSSSVQFILLNRAVADEGMMGGSGEGTTDNGGGGGDSSSPPDSVNKAKHKKEGGGGDSSSSQRDSGKEGNGGDDSKDGEGEAKGGGSTNALAATPVGTCSSGEINPFTNECMPSAHSQKVVEDRKVHVGGSGDDASYKKKYEEAQANLARQERQVKTAVAGGVGAAVAGGTVKIIAIHYANEAAIQSALARMMAHSAALEAGTSLSSAAGAAAGAEAAAGAAALATSLVIPVAILGGLAAAYFCYYHCFGETTPEEEALEGGPIRG